MPTDSRGPKRAIEIAGQLLAPTVLCLSIVLLSFPSARVLAAKIAFGALFAVFGWLQMRDLHYRGLLTKTPRQIHAELSKPGRVRPSLVVMTVEMLAMLAGAAAWVVVL